MSGNTASYYSAPPTGKKARTNRGKQSKSHDGGTKANFNKIRTDMTPDDYIEVIETKELVPECKLPHGIMSKWKVANDTENFTKRIKQGEEMHSDNPTTKFMKENYQKLSPARAGKEPFNASRSTSKGSTIMVNESTWEQVEASNHTTMVNELSKSMKKVTIQDFPTQVRNFQGTLGNTDENGNIQKLNKLVQHPEHFSFQSHSSFMCPGEYEDLVESGDIDEQKGVVDVDLEDQMHPGVFAGAARFNQSTVHICQICGFQAHNPVFSVW